MKKSGPKRYHNRVTAEQAFERGMRDASQRKSRSAIPYADARSAAEWERGYDKAKMEGRKR